MKGMNDRSWIWFSESDCMKDPTGVLERRKENKREIPKRDFIIRV